MNIKCFLIYFLIIVAITGCDNFPGQITIYVSPNGNDKGQGTADSPLLTLQGAIDKVRQEYNEYDTARILLREGTYFFYKPVVVSAQALAMNQHLTIRNHPGERVIFSAGKKINEWKKDQIRFKGFSAATNNNIWYTEVPKNKKFYTLFTSEQRIPRARSEGYKPTVARGEEYNKQILHYPEGAIKDWENLDDVEVVIRPGHAWILNILPIARIDEISNKVYTSIPATYAMTRMAWLYEKLPELFWIENVPEALDEPGEWMLDSGEGKLYYWPLESTFPEIYYPQTVELLRLEGSEEKPVKNITIEGIAFSHTDRYTWKPDDTGLQHDWDIYDASTAMVRLVNSENCSIINCEFTNGGSGGIRLDLYSQQNRITNNTFTNLGGTPILLSGYGPGTRDVNKNNLVSGNRIHDCGEIYWHSPAIFVWQSGNNTINDNLIYNMPYNGICLSGVRPQYFDPQRKGRELTGTMRFEEIGNARTWDEVLPFLHTRNNDVSFNEIHHVMQKLGDGNGIYISGGGHNNIIRNNYIHDLTYHGVQGGIRTDDFQEGTIIKNNLIQDFYRKAVSMKHTNKLINNVFMSLKDGVAYYGTPVPREGFVTLGRGPLEQSEIINNIFYQDGDPITFIKEYPDPPRGEPALIEDCVVENNVFWAPGNPEWLQEKVKELKSKGAPDPGIIIDPEIGFSDHTILFDRKSILDKAGIESFKLPVNEDNGLVP